MTNDEMKDDGGLVSRKQKVKRMLDSMKRESNVVGSIDRAESTEAELPKFLSWYTDGGIYIDGQLIGFVSKGIGLTDVPSDLGDILLTWIPARKFEVCVYQSGFVRFEYQDSDGPSCWYKWDAYDPELHPNAILDLSEAERIQGEKVDQMNAEMRTKRNESV